MDLVTAIGLLGAAAPLVLIVALVISIRRSQAKARWWALEADRHRGNYGDVPSRIFRAGYRQALADHAPHKLAQFDADEAIVRRYP